MAQVNVDLPNQPYTVHIDAGQLDQLGDLAQQQAPHDRCALLADAHVAELYAQKAITSLNNAGYTVTEHRFVSGEDHKTLDAVAGAYHRLLENRLERRSPVITLGGGVSCDMGGFVAATYLRGVPFIQCPTSLLAMVDAAVGGKVGVNVTQGKNLVGAFYQPKTVCMDVLTLKTLPERELRCGLAECVKHAVISDPQLFQWIDQHLHDILQCDPATMVQLLQRNVSIKARVVVEDERETGVRAHLNFGHTFGHAIEKTAGYGTIEHGEAVALGMLAATRLAMNTGLCTTDLWTPLQNLLQRIGLPTTAELADDQTLTNTMQLDKKVQNGKIRLVLPTDMGQVRIIDAMTTAQINDAWQAIRT